MAKTCGVLEMLIDFDFHIHTTFSDGSMSFRELLGRLVELGLTNCGISDHFEVGLPHTVKVSAEEYTKAFSTFKRKARLAGINVFLGAETGISQAGLLLPPNLPRVDYLIASVHRVEGSPSKEAEYWDLYKSYIDGSVARGGFQVLGHVEGYMPLAPFKEAASTFGQRREMERHFAAKYLGLDWYGRLAENLLKNDIAVEIHEMSASPRLEVLKLLHERGVKFSYGTDSHARSQLSKREYVTRVIRELRLDETDIVRPEIGGAKCIR